jgi:hypothetical protein
MTVFTFFEYRMNSPVSSPGVAQNKGHVGRNVFKGR